MEAGSVVAKTSAIILVPDTFSKADTERHIRKYGESYSKYEILVVSDDEIEDKTLSGMYSHLESLIQTASNPPLVIPTHDLGAIVHAALALKFPQIKAPSLLSEFLCLHKGDTYKISSPKYTLPFLQAGADDIVDQDMLTKAGIIDFPLFIKPTFGTNTDMGKKVNSVRELNEFTKNNMTDIKKSANSISEFLFRFLSDASVKSSMEETWVIQPFVDEKAKFISVDGLIYSGQIIIWNLHEFIFWEKEPSVIKGLASPVELTAAARENLHEAYYFLIGKLKSRGFDNQYAALEAFVTTSGKISISEINGRTVRAMCRGYVKLNRENGDNVLAMLQIASGEVPKQPVENPGVHIFVGYVCIKDVGKASDFIDINTAKSIDEMELKVAEDTVLSPRSEWGHQVAYCHTTGGSRAEAMETCRGLVEKIIIVKEKCLWLVD